MRFLRFLIMFFLITSMPLVARAELPINKKYSNRAFLYHSVSFKDIPAKEFNNTIIQGSCFYQEWDWDGNKPVIKDIFPDGMTGVVFRNCNLDNVYIPPGNTVEGGTNKRIQVQNDWSDWVLDSNLKPKEPVNKKMRLEAGVSIDPKDIPEKKFTEEERKQFEEILNSISVTP